LTPEARISAAVRAGAWNVLILFAAGALLGTLRIMVVLPATGEVAAVLLELPVMLALSWIVSARLVARCHIPAQPAPRLIMGAVAFALLMAAELLLSVTLFGRPVSAHLAQYATVPGALGLCGQTGFALIPWLQGRIAARGA